MSDEKKQRTKLRLDGAGCDGFILTLITEDGQHEIAIDLTYEEAHMVVDALIGYERQHAMQHLADALTASMEEAGEAPEGSVEIEPEPKQLDWIDQLERDLNNGGLNG